MTRRAANGDGNVRKRLKGGWEARWSYVDPDTEERRRVSFYGPTAENVRDQLKQAQDRVGREEPVKDSVQRFRDYAEHWIETELEASDRAESTKEQYRGLARKHLIPALGSKQLSQIKTSDVKGLLARLKKDGTLSESTRKSVFLVLRVILTAAVEDKLLASNPAAKVKTPKVQRRDAAFLTPEQAASVMAHTEGLRYASAVKLAVSTGMRRGEVAGLKWTDINLEGGYLKVTRTLNRVDGTLLLSTPKTDRSRRRVPLSPSVVTMLKAHKATQAAEKLKAGDQWQDEGLVFCNALGGRVDPRSSILRTVEIASKKAEVEGVTVHSLRHAFASAAIDAGYSLKVVADILGHSSIAITGDIYTHATEASAQAAVDNLSAKFGL